MQLALETWHKPAQATQSDELGLTKLEIGENEYRSLEKIEKALHEGDEREAFIAVDPSRLALQTPKKCGKLADCQIRVYLREDDDSGHFHLVGRREKDDELIYTNAVMVRTLAI